MRVLAAVIAVVLMLTISSYACAQSYNNKSDLLKDKTLYVALLWDIPDLNYFSMSTNCLSKPDTLGILYEGLLSYTLDLRIHKYLAESYEILPQPEGDDVFTIIVHLRRNVTFHDGVEMTAKDVVFSYQVIYWCTPYQSDLNPLYWLDPKWDRWDGNGKSHIGVEAIDNYTVKFHLSEKYCLFFYKTLSIPIIPEHIWKNHLMDAGTGDSQDMQLDYGYGKDMSEANATIGTSPWRFVEWVPGERIVMEVYEDYWGKNVYVDWNGTSFPLYPQHLKRIVFKVYPSLNSAITALKSGYVDYIRTTIRAPWTTNIHDPNIGLAINDDYDFCCLAFNLRKSPLNDKSLRKAIAHCIDKKYIVDAILGGYGEIVNASIPLPSERYINKSAKLPAFNQSKAKDILDSSGYFDVNGDGWRDSPDGSSINLAILTVPKEYYPVLGDIGAFISKNLKSVGLNVDSSPIDFDTLDAKVFCTMDFDMYLFHFRELFYWKESFFPEDYLYCLFSYYLFGGFAGYTDPRINDLLNKMPEEIDTEKRIKIIKDMQGIVADALPYVILYRSKNVEIYRKGEWTGWVSAFRSVYNRYSLSVLAPKILSTPDYGKVDDHALIVDCWIPSEVATGEEIRGYVFVHDELYRPYADANVSVFTSMGDVVSGKTSNYGIFVFNVTAPYEPITVKFQITAEYGDAKTNIVKSMKVLGIYRAIAARVLPEKYIVEVGEGINVTVEVRNDEDCPVEGANVSVQYATVLGDIYPKYGYTDDKGKVIFRYTAPSSTEIPGRNLAEYLKFVVSYDRFKFTTSCVIGVENNQQNYYFIKILNITKGVLSAGESAKVLVKVTDINGNPVPDYVVHIEVGYTRLTNIAIWDIRYFEDTQNVSVDSCYNATDSNGETEFTITANANINDARFIKVYGKDQSLYDMEGIYVGNETGMNSGLFNYTGIYSLRILSNETHLNPTEKARITVEVRDSFGNPVPNAVVWMKIPPTNFGQPAYFEDVISGDSNYFYCVGAYAIVFTDSSGRGYVNVSTEPLISDVPIKIVAWVDDLWYEDEGSTLGPDAGFWSEFPLGTGGVEQILLMKAPVMTAEVNLEKLVYYQDDIYANVHLDVHFSGLPDDWNADVFWKIGNVWDKIDLDGTDFNIYLPYINYTTTISGKIVLHSEMYAINIPVEFSAVYLPETSYHKREMQNAIFITSIENLVYNASSTAKIKIKVKDINGEPCGGVRVFVQGINLVNSSSLTDENGTAEFIYQVENISGYKLNIIKVVAYSAYSKTEETFGILVVGEIPSQTQEKNETTLQPNPQKIIENSMAIILTTLIIMGIFVGWIMEYKRRKIK